MKKVLVATCVVAMTAFGITNASADTVTSARGSAYGIDIGGSLLDGLIEREPEVESNLGDGLVSEDIVTVPVDPVTIDAVGAVVANTSAESTIVPITGDQEGGATGGDGGDGGGDDDEGLLGGIFDGLLGGGDDDDGGGGGLVGGIAGLSDSDAEVVEAQQLGGGGDDGGDDGGDGLLGGLLGGDLLGGLLNNDDGSDDGQIDDDEILIPAANAQGFARITDLNILVEEGVFGELGLDDTVETLLLDALLEIDTVTAEVVATCVDGAVFFDTASNTLTLNDEPVSLVDDLLDTVADLELLDGILDIDRNVVGVTEDGNGVFVDALRVEVLGGGGGLIGGGDDDDGGTVGGAVQAQQLGGGGDDDEALIELVIGHAEASIPAQDCAAAAGPPPTVADLPPSGPGPTLPVTGGGLGALPAVLALGLAGGAVAAGRLALRSRRENSL